MPDDGDGAGRKLPEYVRLQRRWYRRNLFLARISHYILEILVLLCGGVIAVSSALDLSLWVPSVLGATITVLTGLRALFGWQDNRRARAQASVKIEAEIARYSRGAAPYDTGDVKRDGDLLQEAVLTVVQTETAAWAEQEAGRSRG